MSRKVMLTVVIVSTLLAYLNLASFAYFSDTETIENVTITAGTWESPEVEVLYSCPVLFLFCGPGGESFRATPRGWEKPVGVEKAPGDIEIKSDGRGIKCGGSCRGLLFNIWLRPVGEDVTLEAIRIEWSGNGTLDSFFIGSTREPLFVVGNIDQASPAEFEVGRELGEGVWYPIAFKFRDMKLRRRYSFSVTFIFSGNYTRSIDFTVGG